MLLLDADAIHSALPMRRAVEVMKRAFAQLSAGRAVAPPRSVHALPDDGGDLLLMPGMMDEGRALGVKLLTLLPANPAAGRPLIHALMTLWDGATGEPLALLDGGALTALRTGAASGAATDLLACRDAETSALIGAGRQARTQLEAVAAVRRLRAVRVFCRAEEAARRFAAHMSPRLGIEVTPVRSAREAIAGADIVCTATTSATPVFDDADIGRGTHINAVGVYHLDQREIPAATVARAKVVVDQLQTAREEAGDLAMAIAEGVFSWEQVHGELGELVSGRKPGRESEDEVTLFKSVGLAVQDVAAARAVYEHACQHGLGMPVEL